jgi:hypothetical protein
MKKALPVLISMFFLRCQCSLAHLGARIEMLNYYGPPAVKVRTEFSWRNSDTAAVRHGFSTVEVCAGCRVRRVAN